jgi:hypothetical protein
MLSIHDRQEPFSERSHSPIVTQLWTKKVRATLRLKRAPAEVVPYRLGRVSDDMNP